MKRFAELITVLGTSTKTNDKLEALVQYFTEAADADKVWVIALFSGRRPKRLVNSTLLKTWCYEIADLPPWLFDECYNTVGDLAETIALLLPEPDTEMESQSLADIIASIAALETQTESEKKDFITSTWSRLNKDEKFVFNKILTGNFRIGVSQKIIVNAIARTVEVAPELIAYSISGKWDPFSTSFNSLTTPSPDQIDFSKPYPFYLAFALDSAPEELGPESEWQAEWKWDGIRGQLIKRNNEIFVWSRGEELITDKFPEYTVLQQLLPDGLVLDGEIIPAINGMPLPFAVMQTRIGRKNISKKQLLEAPIVFFAYDVLEWGGTDFRNQPLYERRCVLETLIHKVNHPVLILSPSIEFDDWQTLKNMREKSRDHAAEGLMLKRKQSIYQVGRKIGDWWKWKVAPLVIDAVLIYAQKGHGRRSNLYTDYTFAVKDGDKLVSFAKAYSGLTDKEIAQVDAFVKRNSVEKFGPVRTVKPELVFEIAFEGIAASNRHKSGVALRFPRINRWRQDKKPTDINSIDDLKKMLETYGK